ncbi:myelin transcription factor 1 isoform X1 [Cinnamomum micranthum f. kanehirae]|uniref:Myelin transcription factor 1 isoform X1 n=1 Tax=Cinnamomum micranthum f. kanehirae TaxID=337451 RepID=A0A3S4P5K9_9MAGN|nr:myelin transcription factor 1 isoform X1 [Cinnamomum micranthum f. kanehirae]
METPSSTRRVTRSQNSAASSNLPTSWKKEGNEKGLLRSKQGKSDRSVLIDITNDSPIIGLAAGSLETPSSLAKNRGRAKQTPGSGEALLRGQVKALLQMVEEEGELLPSLSVNQRPLLPFQALLNSPTTLLAPTPTNTPVLSNPLEGGNNDIKGLMSVIPIAEAQKQDSKITQAGLITAIHVAEVQKEDSKMIQAPTDALEQEIVGSFEGLVTRALLFDSPGKSEVSNSSRVSISSVLTYEGCSFSVESLLEEDDASDWSVQVNASSHKDKEEEEETEEYVCLEETKGTLEFKGGHTRFIYNDRDEIEGEKEVKENDGTVVCSVSPSILCLKGLPVPEGKHLRFPEEEEED